MSKYLCLSKVPACWLEKSQLCSHFPVNLKVIVGLTGLSWNLTLYFNIQSFGRWLPLSPPFSGNFTLYKTDFVRQWQPPQPTARKRGVVAASRLGVGRGSSSGEAQVGLKNQAPWPSSDTPWWQMQGSLWGGESSLTWTLPLWAAWCHGKSIFNLWVCVCVSMSWQISVCC